MELRRGKKWTSTLSLDESLRMDNEDGGVTLGETVKSDECLSSVVEETLMVNMILGAASKILSEREYRALCLRYGLEEGTGYITQQEIAEKLGISRSYVAKILKRAEGKLKIHFKDYDLNF